MEYKQKVQIFIECIKKSNAANEAILLANEKHNLNAADSIGGLGSDSSAWKEANQLTGYKFSEAQ